MFKLIKDFFKLIYIFVVGAAAVKLGAAVLLIKPTPRPPDDCDANKRSP